jgi:hypothetical protein
MRGGMRELSPLELMAYDGSFEISGTDRMVLQWSQGSDETAG